MEMMALPPSDRGVLDETRDRVLSGLLQECRVLVDLTAAQRTEGGGDVGADTPAAHDEPETRPRLSTTRYPGTHGVVTTITSFSPWDDGRAPR